jgi:hypothetical protein
MTDEPITSDPEPTPLNPELDWRLNRINAATYVALQLREEMAESEDDDVGTFGLGALALFIAGPVAYFLYRRALFGALYVLAVPAAAFLIFLFLGFWAKTELKQRRDKAAQALEGLASELGKEEASDDEASDAPAKKQGHGHR